MSRRGAVALLVLLLSAVPVAAQQVDIEARPPLREREPRIVTPPLRYETTRPTDQGYYERDVRVPYDPAFIEPFATEFETPGQSGRLGLSGWTAPNTPVGSTSAAGNAYQEVSGWFALGFSIIWNGPPPVKATPASAPARAPR